MQALPLTVAPTIREEVLRDARYPVHRIADKLLPYLRVLVEQFRPQQIILFGSYARGQPDEHSDVDLLIIMPFEGDSIRKAVEIRSAVHAGFPVDLLVRTPAQVEQRIAWNDWFMREIVGKGKVVYAAAHHGVDHESRGRLRLRSA